MEFRILLTVQILWWTKLQAIRLNENIGGRGKIPDLIRDYLYSRNFETVVSNDDDQKSRKSDASRENILKSWRFPLNIKRTTNDQLRQTSPNDDGHKCGPTTTTTNVILLPLLNVVADTKDAVQLLRSLGLDDAPTLYADGKVDYHRKRDKLASIFTLPLFNRCCNQKNNREQGRQRRLTSASLCRRNVQSAAERPQKLSIFPPNSALFLDPFTPKHKECETSDDSKDCLYDSEDTTRMMKLVIYLKKNQRPVTFVKAVELCSKRGMMLPIIRDQLDLADLREELEEGRDYWIGLGKSECQADVCPYEWMDGIKDTNFVRQFQSDQLRPKTGPMEFCVINVSHRKSHISIKCYSDVDTTAYYICTHSPVPTPHDSLFSP